MYINNKHIESYNAKLLNRTILPSAFEVDSFWSKNSLTPLINNDIKRRYKEMLLEIEFKGTENEIEINKSRLIKEISISTIKFNALDSYYDGYLVSTELQTKARGYEVLSVSLNVLDHEEENTVIVNGSSSIVLNSTGITPCILEVTPSTDISSLNIIGLGEDITLNNLTTGKEIIIDGEKGLVTEEGQNKWNDYDSWGFPKLLPGENQISISEDIEITIKYSPRWL